MFFLLQVSVATISIPNDASSSGSCNATDPLDGEHVQTITLSWKPLNASDDVDTVTVTFSGDDALGDGLIAPGFFMIKKVEAFIHMNEREFPAAARPGKQFMWLTVYCLSLSHYEELFLNLIVLFISFFRVVGKVLHLLSANLSGEGLLSAPMNLSYFCMSTRHIDLRDEDSNYSFMSMADVHAQAYHLTDKYIFGESALQIAVF